MENLESEQIKAFKDAAFKEIEGNLQKELSELDVVARKNGVTRVRALLVELENKKREMQQNERIADRFKEGLIKQLDEQIALAKKKVEGAE